LVIGNTPVCKFYVIKVDGLCTSLEWEKKNCYLLLIIIIR